MRKWGFTFLILGVGAFLLPYAGVQFRVVKFLQLASPDYGLPVWGMPLVLGLFGLILLWIASGSSLRGVSFPNVDSKHFELLHSDNYNSATSGSKKNGSSSLTKRKKNAAVAEPSATHSMAATQRLQESLDKLEELTLRPFEDYKRRSDERHQQLNELRLKYETQFTNWAEFESKIRQRFYATMAQPNLAQETARRVESDPESLDTLYYLAAEDTLLHDQISGFRGAELLGLDTHDYWISVLIEREFEELTKEQCAVLPENEHLNKTLSLTDISSQDEIIRTIENLARLRDQGILREEEFHRKKAELLDRL